MPHLHSVNLATAVSYGEWTGDMGSTGIDKRAVSNRVRLFDDHVDGDHVVDRKHHGGPYKAVYAYSLEDAAWWEQRLGQALAPGAFGENLTTAAIDINQLRIGEQLRVGSALLQVTEPRIPCRVFAGFWQRPDLIKEFTAAGLSGTYLRILEEGAVAAGDVIGSEERPQHDVTVGLTFAARTGGGVDRQALRPAFEFFPPKWQAWLDAGS